MKYRIIKKKSLKDIINEELIKEISADDAYNKFYKDFDRETYNQLIQVDPTYKNNQIGKYTKWLMKTYNSNVNYERVARALTTFDKFQNKLEPHEKDINKFNTTDLIKLTTKLKSRFKNNDLIQFVKKVIYKKELKQNIIEKINEDPNYGLRLQTLYSKVLKLDKNAQKKFSAKSNRYETADEYLDGSNEWYNDYINFNYNLVKNNIETLSDDIEIVHDDPEKEILVVKVGSYEASNLIGSKDWCISYEEHYWDDYNENGRNNTYFIFDFNKGGSDPMAAVGVVMTPNNEINAVHDKFDGGLNGPQFSDHLNNLGLKETLFKINKRLQGEKQYGKDGANQPTIDIDSYYKKEDLQKNLDGGYPLYNRKIDNEVNYIHTMFNNFMETYSSNNNKDQVLKYYQKPIKLNVSNNYGLTDPKEEPYSIFSNYEALIKILEYGEKNSKQPKYEPIENDVTHDEVSYQKFLTEILTNHFNILNENTKRYLYTYLKNKDVDILKLTRQIKQGADQELTGNEFGMATKRDDINLKPIIMDKMNKIIKNEPVNMSEKEIEFAIDNGYEKYWKKYYDYKLQNILDYPIDYEDAKLMQKVGLSDNMKNAVKNKAQYGIESLNSIEKSIHDMS